MSKQHEQDPDRAAEPRETEQAAAPAAIPPRPRPDAGSAGQAGAWWRSAPPAPAASGGEASGWAARAAEEVDDGDATAPREPAPGLPGVRSELAAEELAVEEPASGGPIGWGGATAAPRPAEDATRPYGVPQPAPPRQPQAPTAPRPASQAPVSAVPYDQRGPQALSPEESRAYRGPDLSQMVGRSPYEEFGRFHAPEPSRPLGQPGSSSPRPPFGQQHADGPQTEYGPFGQGSRFGQPEPLGRPEPFGPPAEPERQPRPQHGAWDGFAWQGQASGGGAQGVGTQRGELSLGGPEGHPGFAGPQQLPDYERSSPKRRSPALGVAAAVLALLALVFVCLVPGILPVSVGLALGGIAIVLGAMGLRRSTRLPAMLGIAGGALAAAVAVVTYLVVAFV